MSPFDSEPLDLQTAWRRFGDRLRRWLERRVRQPADAEDVLQDVFLRLAESRAGSVPDERLGAWLHRVARNTLIDAHRRNHVRRADSLTPDAAIGLPEADTGGSMARCLEPMLVTLPESYAHAVREADLRGRAQTELARELDISYSALKSRVQRGRAMLRDNLVACCRPDEDLDCAPCGDDAPCT